MTDVGQWLSDLGLAQHVQTFAEQQIDGDLLPTLSDADLRELGVVALGQRKRLLAAIEALRDAQDMPLARTPAQAQARVAPAPPPTAQEARQPATTAVPQGERRQLSLMFCDLVDSTAMAARLDPEDLRKVLGAYHDAVTRSVAAYEGYVAQFLGDGVLVYFGYPRAHEDNADRAVRAALAVVEATARVRTPGGMAVQTRVGIATGVVVVSEVGSGTAAAEVSASGEAPNLAARLQGIAAPGTVAICRATRRLISAVFECDDLGAFELKGFAESVPVWRVLGLAQVEDRFDAQRVHGLGPLVGREEETGALLRRWQRVVGGEGQAVLLSGEPGLGKSRLVAQIEHEVAAAPHSRLRCFCSPYYTETPLHPFIASLSGDVRLTAAEDVDARVARLAADLQAWGCSASDDLALLCDMLGIRPTTALAPFRGSPREKKSRSIDILIARLRALAARQPLLLIIEDVHWADPTSRDLLDSLVEQVVTMPVLVLITHRPHFEAPWAGRPHVATMVLNRLGRAEAAGIVGRITGGRALPPELLEEILSRTDGVPLFVEELTRAVLEGGMLKEYDGRLGLAAPMIALVVPQTLQASLLARLDGLGLAKVVAQVGAAIGREFSHRLLSAVVDIEATELAAMLASFIASGLAFQRGQGTEATYQFKHALVQDAAYDSLLKSRRIELHRNIAQALSTRFSEESRPEITAHHHACAGEPDRAVPLLLVAARQAFDRAGYSEARAHAGRARALCDALDDVRFRELQTLDALLVLGEALLRDGENEQAMQSLEEAAGRAAALGLSDTQARAAVGFADASWRPGLADGTAVRLLQQADVALGSQAGPLKVQVLSWLAVALDMVGLGEQADAVGARAMAMAEPLGVVLAATSTQSRRAAITLLRLDRQDEMFARVQLAIESARENGDWEHAVDMSINITPNTVLLRQMDRVKAQIADIERHVEVTRQPFHRYLVSCWRAGVAFYEGRFGDCEALAQRAVSEGQQVSGLNAAGPFSVQMFNLSREAGRLTEMAPLLRQFLKGTPDEGVWRPGLALMFVEIGAHDEARAEFDRLAHDDFAALPRDVSWLNAMAMLAEVCHSLNDPVRAAVLYRLLAPYEQCNVVAPPLVICFGCTARQLGLLATTLGEWDTAATHFSLSITLDEQAGGIPWSAHARHAWADMLVRRGNPDDQSDVLSLNEAAARTAAQLGMTALADRTAALRERLATNAT